METDQTDPSVLIPPITNDITPPVLQPPSTLSTPTTPAPTTPNPHTDITSSPVVRRSTRSHNPPQCYGYTVCDTAADENGNPSYDQAMSGPNKQLWLRAMEEEFTSFETHNVGTLVEKPEGANILGGMWIFSQPKDEHHQIIKYKARWVLFGNHQVYGEDYIDTYASVGKADSWRILLAISIKCQWFIIQFDIKTAFLNGDMVDRVYGRKVKGFRRKLHPKRVWLLNRSLYGSKQGARRWQQHFERTIAAFDLKPTDSDPAVYTLKNSVGILIIHLHVNDSDVFCSSEILLKSFQSFLNNAYTVKWTQTPTLYLGINFAYDRISQTASISQKHYIESTLDRFAMTNCNIARTPLPTTMPMTKGSDSEVIEAKDPPYQQLVGCLHWIAGSTRPDIAHAVSQLSAFNSCWTTTHWTAAKHVPRYLKGTIDYRIVYGTQDDDSLTVWSDADFSQCPDTRRPISGYLFQLNGGMVLWRSQKQPVVALSTLEAEFISAAEAAKQLLWMKGFLFDIFHPIEHPISFHIDSTSAISTITEEAIKQKSKHIDRRFHFLRHQF